TAWPVSGPPSRLIPGSLQAPVLISSKHFDASSVVHSRSPSRTPPDALSAPFPRLLTTTVFSQRSRRRFEAALRRTAPRGQNPHDLCSTTQQLPTYTGSPFPFRTHEGRGFFQDIDNLVLHTHAAAQRAASSSRSAEVNEPGVPPAASTRACLTQPRSPSG